MDLEKSLGLLNEAHDTSVMYSTIVVAVSESSIADGGDTRRYPGPGAPVPAQPAGTGLPARLRSKSRRPPSALAGWLRARGADGQGGKESDRQRYLRVHRVILRKLISSIRTEINHDGPLSG